MESLRYFWGVLFGYGIYQAKAYRNSELIRYMKYAPLARSVLMGFIILFLYHALANDTFGIVFLIFAISFMARFMAIGDAVRRAHTHLTKNELWQAMDKANLREEIERIEEGREQ